MFRIYSLSLAIRSLVMVVVCAALFSFSARPGGDSFTIFLNDKLMVEQFVHRDKDVKNLSLGATQGDDQLRIHYSHCGQTGTARAIAVQSGRQVLKSWNFADGAGTPMLLKVKEIVALQKANGNKLVQLVYTSKELPEGRTLASIGASNASARRD